MDLHADKVEVSTCYTHVHITDQVILDSGETGLPVLPP